MTAQDREVEGIEDALALVGRQPAATHDPGPDTGPARRAGQGPSHGASRGGGAEPYDHAAEPYDHAADQGHAADRGHGRSQGSTNPVRDDQAPEAAGTDSRSARHRAESWDAARALAARSARSAPAARARRVPLGQALGQALAEPLTALTDLPSFDTSAMDGWAVSGPGPWSVRTVKDAKDTKSVKGAKQGTKDTGRHASDTGPSTTDAPAAADDSGILAGHADAGPLPDGEAVRIATGARIPADATAVIRSEHARTDGSGRLHAEREVIQGQDIRPRGQECRSGDRLLPAGSLVTPAALGLAAAAGYDELLTVPRPSVEVLVLGDELLAKGLPHDGLIRDALGPMLAPWLHTLGADVIATRRIGDSAEALRRAVTKSTADLVITTGGTAGGPVDHVHPVLRKVGAELLVDGVAVRPGHPMLLARLTSGRHLVGLPGNPLAAVSGLVTLAEPLLRTLAGRAPRTPYHAPLRDAVHGHPYDTRLVPFVHRDEGLVPLRFNGPAMLRGIAAADGIAVVPPGGARPGEELEVLDLPWAASADGGCFT
ncbi:molybdopterin molybdotransferase MoeA [Streptomyces sp. NPDC088116]|uniref:molybdopterin molybdotransferase MoeA n=1 Tax=Streptomyces sp. NPDC088116 TaxID=3365825 RepID=UPI003812BC5B